MRPRPVLLLAVLVLTLSGCSEPGGGPSAAPTTGHPTPSASPVDRPAPTLPRLDLGEEPLASDVPMNPEIESVVGDRALSVRDRGMTLSSVDLRTGEEVWTRDSGGKFEGIGPNVRVRGGVAATEDAAVMYVDHYACTGDGCPPDQDPTTVGWGVAAISPSDGSVAWSAMIADPVSRTDDEFTYRNSQYVRGAAMIDGVLVVGVEVVMPGVEPAPPGLPMQFTIGLDPGDGSQLWRTDGFVLSTLSSDAAWGYLSEDDESVPARIAPRTGEIIARTDHPGAALAGVGSTGALLEIVEDAEYRWVASDGTDLPDGQADGRADCAVGPGPLTCVIGDAASISTLEADGTISPGGPTGFHRLLFTDGDYVFAVDSHADVPADEAIGASVVIDRAGNRLSDPFPGTAHLRTGDLLIVDETGPDHEGVQVRSITTG